MAVSASLGRVLAAGRAQFNARVAEARRRTPGFPDADFAAFLQDGVDGVVVAVEQAAPARTSPVVVAAFEIALALCAHGLVGPGSRCPLVNRVWRELLPLLAQAIAESPGPVMGAMSNAAVYLARTPGVRAVEWLERMCALAPQAKSAEELRNLGSVLAWRCGAAHFRAGALAAADSLAEPLALAALDAPTGLGWSAMRTQLHRNAWWSPHPETRRSWSVGAFAGFGGTFSEPPQVRAAPQQGFWVKSGARFSLLVADAWGALLLPATAQEFEAAFAGGCKDSVVVVKGRQLIFAGSRRTVDLDLPADGLAVACNEDAVAVASPFTHAITVYALQ